VTPRMILISQCYRLDSGVPTPLVLVPKPVRVLLLVVAVCHFGLLPKANKNIYLNPIPPNLFK